MINGGEQGDFRERWQRVRDRLERAASRARRNPAEITLIAVTKTVTVQRLREALACGCRIFGENRVQEAIGKMDALADAQGPEWHFLGPIQTNKVKAVIGRFSLIHAIDRIEIAERLDQMLREQGLVQPVLLEVNIAEEASKHGFRPGNLIAAARRLANCTALQIRGLMTIPPVGPSEASRPHFRYLKQLSLELEAAKIPGVVMKELSMGMSEDFECAVEEGATMVRIGTALFGARPFSSPLKK